jgi:rhodanese-related sulfurtransferase
MSLILNTILIIAAAWFILRGIMPVKGVKNITAEELKAELHKKDKQFIDVRTPAEFKANHIRQFKNIPLQKLTQKANELSKDKEVIVICQSGMRSKQASKVLKQLGFKKITNVKGGMNAW